MMKSPCSRIPHILRAFAEKQASSPLTGLPLQRDTRANLCLNSRQRRFASVSPLSKLSTVAHRVSVARPPQKPRPTLSRGRDPDYGFEQPPRPKRSVWDTAYVFTAYGFAAVVGIYVVFVAVSYRRDVEAYNQRPDKLEQNADVSDRWKSTTRNFDWEVDSTEKMTLLKRKRRRLVREAYGDVLEVSVGTGRNMDFYDTRPYSPTEAASYGRDTRHMITSLTFNDQSEVMVENAKKKWELSQSEKRAGDRFTGKVDFVLGDAGKPGVIRRPPGGFDTIIQSMGICSMTDPVGFLKTVGKLVRQPGEEIQNQSPKRLREEEDQDGLGGRIFLLEHGKAYSTWAWLNSYLDNSAAMHADRYGCWYNKDIGKIIDEAGLVVERIKGITLALSGKSSFDRHLLLQTQGIGLKTNRWLRRVGSQLCGIECSRSVGVNVDARVQEHATLGGLILFWYAPRPLAPMEFINFHPVKTDMARLSESMLV